jgi:uncharacterized membrane-anchored protein YhcB (DUF1043 family)
MDSNIFLSILEFISSLLMEGVILGLVFQLISNRSTKQTAQSLQKEMDNIEKQNKFIFEQLEQEIRETKSDIINQIKENNTNK